MPIIASAKGKTFHIAPAGMTQAACFDIWDIGLQKREFKKKIKIQHRIIVTWEINERIESQDDYNGKRHRIRKEYTLSLHEKAALYKDLVSWRGRPFTEEEKNEFDLEKLIGANCFLNIVHVESGGNTYANLSAINPLPKGTPLITVETARSIPDWIAKKQAEAVSPDIATDAVAPDEGDDYAPF